ncbi:swr complex subunit [Tulasnella sp. 403]|nr:swr complex subunit [Tulasnella sp. 403]
MASASDVRAILNITSQGNLHKPSKKQHSSARRESGISRELYQLIGDSAPTLVAQYARPKLKQKPDFGSSKVKWEWKEFRNPARTDDLPLHHWEKTSPAPMSDEYPFAKFNQQSPNALFYSMDEYTRMLEDPDWSKEETDYLFNLVREFDVRFYIVADRYDFPGGKPRSMQDLKARYYNICRKLIKSRPFAGDDAAKTATIQSYAYDKDREIQRRVYIDGLFARTPAQIAEEEALYIECKRIEQNERRFQRERDDLLRTLAGIDSGLASLTLRIDDPTNSLPPHSLTAPRRLKRPDGAEPESPVTATSNNMIALPSPYSGPTALPGAATRNKSASISVGAGSTPKPQPSISLASIPPYVAQAQETTFDPVHCLTQPTPPSGYPPPSSITKSAHKPVHLRSTLIPTPKASVLQKINGIITELGVHPTKLVMPTSANLEKMEALQAAAAGLVDMKKMVDRVDQEIRVLKARLRGGSEAGETDADGTADPPERSLVDRATSEISANTGDKRHKRSASVASSSTSLATDTRAGKRQRR